MEVPLSEYLSSLKIAELKTLIQENMSADELVKIRIPRSKTMLINFIEDHKLIKPKKIVKKKKTAGAATTNNNSKQSITIKQQQQDSDGDGDNNQKEKVTIGDEAPAAEEEEEAPITSQKKKKVVNTKKKSTITYKKKQKEVDNDDDKKEENEPAITRETLENMTVVALKAKYFKGVVSTKIPKSKALIIDHICKQLGISSDDEEEEEEEEVQIQEEEEETKMEMKKEQVKEKDNDNYDQLMKPVVRIDLMTDECELDNDKTNHPTSKPVVIPSTPDKQQQPPVQQNDNVVQVESDNDEEDDGEDADGEDDDEMMEDVKYTKKQKRHEKTPSKKPSIITKTATPQKTRDEEIVRKGIEQLSIGGEKQQPDLHLLPIDPSQHIHQGTLPIDLEEKILLMLLQHNDNHRRSRFIGYRPYMWNLALVSRRWFNTVSSVITHLSYSPNIPLPYIRKAIGGEEPQNTRFQLVKRIQSIDLGAFLLHQPNEIDTKTKFLSLIDLGSDDEGDSSDEEGDYVEEEEDEDDDEYYYEMHDYSDGEVDNTELHSDVELDSSDEESEEQMAERIKKERAINQPSTNAFNLSKYYLSKHSKMVNPYPLKSIHVTNIRSKHVGRVFRSRCLENIDTLRFESNREIRFGELADIITCNYGISSYDIEVRKLADGSVGEIDCMDSVQNALAFNVNLKSLRYRCDHGILIYDYVVSWLRLGKLKELTIDHRSNHPWSIAGDWTPKSMQTSMEKLKTALAQNKSINKLSINNLGTDPTGNDAHVRCISTTVFDSVFFINNTITTLAINVSYITPKFFETFKPTIENHNKTLRSLELIGSLKGEMLMRLMDLIESNPVNLVELNFSTDPNSMVVELKYYIELAFAGNTNLRTLSMGGGNQEFYAPIIEGIACSDCITSLYINRYVVSYLPTLKFMQEYLKSTTSLRFLNNYDIRDLSNLTNNNTTVQSN